MKEHTAAFSAGMRDSCPWPLQMTPGILLFEVQPSFLLLLCSVKHENYSQPAAAKVDVCESEAVNQKKKIDKPKNYWKEMVTFFFCNRRNGIRFSL